MSASTSRTLPPEIAESVSVMALIERGKAEGQIAGDDVRRAFEADQIPATQWKNVLRSLNQILEEEGVTLMVSAAEPKRTRKSVAAKSPAKRTATKTVAAKPVTSRKAAAPAAPAAPASEPAAEEEAPAKKTAAKKTTAKKATAKKTTAKKTAAKKTTAKKEDGELLEDEAAEEPKAATEEPEGTENAGFVLSDEDEDDAPAQQVAAAGATADPVKDYLKQIGKVPLLNAEQEYGRPPPGSGGGRPLIGLSRFGSSSGASGQRSSSAEDAGTAVSRSVSSCISAAIFLSSGSNLRPWWAQKSSSPPLSRTTRRYAWAPQRSQRSAAVSGLAEVRTVVTSPLL
ncbi:hypothetical protein STENM223S_09341 [Streptomyces tendae]